MMHCPVNNDTPVVVRLRDKTERILLAPQKFDWSRNPDHNHVVKWKRPGALFWRRNRSPKGN